MREETKYFVLGIMVLSFGLLFVLIMILSMATNKKVGTKEVPCYDNEHNIIKDLICVEDCYSNIFGTDKGCNLFSNSQSTAKAGGPQS